MFVSFFASQHQPTYFFLAFKGCSRMLVTVDLNLTSAEFIQFYFMYGCLITPNSRNQGVLLEYSVNGGISWSLLMEIFYDQFSKPGLVDTFFCLSNFLY